MLERWIEEAAGATGPCHFHLKGAMNAEVLAVDMSSSDICIKKHSWPPREQNSKHWFWHRTAPRPLQFLVFQG